LNKKFLLGLVGSTSFTKQSLKPNLFDKTLDTKDRYHSLGVLGLYQGGEKQFNLSGLLSFGRHNFSASRTWVQPVHNAADLQCLATSEHKGLELDGAFEFGWSEPLSENALCQPYIGAGFSSLREDAYQENSINVTNGASNDYGLVFPAIKNINRYVSGGFEFIQLITLESGIVQLNGRLGYTVQHTDGQETTTTFAYVGDPNTFYNISTPNKYQGNLDVNLGMNIAFNDGVVLSTSYVGGFSSMSTSHMVVVSGHYSFA
jgi:uncharacterized protein with beta-barrel porin domain